MRASLPAALIFLLFAFTTLQNLTLAAENVLDMHGNPLVPGKLYHILDATNTARGIQTEKTLDYTCPISVIIGADAKKVILHTGDQHAKSIKVGEVIDFEFAEVSYCAKSANWSVEVHGNKEYPVVIGPPQDAETMPGVFHITKSKELSYAYYISFKIKGIDDYVLTASPYRHNQDLYRLEFCPDEKDEKFSVVFEPYKKPVPVIPATPTPSPPPPAAPTPTLAPAPSSTFVPLIRKIVR